MHSAAAIAEVAAESRADNRILQGDCLRLCRDLPEGCADLILFSPPYDAIRHYGGDWTIDLPKLGARLLPLAKEGGICAVVIGDGTKNHAKTLTTFSLAANWCAPGGWRLFECCIYHRDGNPGAWWSRRFRVDHEYILLFVKGEKPSHFDKTPLMVPSKHAGKTYSGTDRQTNGGLKRITPKAVNAKKCRGTVWRYATSNTEGNRTKLQHPATFPDKLAEDIILCFSKPGDLVIDPMCGSGTTCVMAAKNARRYIGMEISKEYCTIAERRLQEETPSATLPVADGIRIAA